MAERIRLKAYIVISFLLTVVHSIPAHWVWSNKGFLYNLGVIDSAGCSVVCSPPGAGYRCISWAALRGSWPRSTSSPERTASGRRANSR